MCVGDWGVIIISAHRGPLRTAGSVAPDSVSTMQIYRGAIPFIVIQLIGLILIIQYPDLVTWGLR
jgi:TRAP-type mannitol/chloroaromatic compound transport system permease large subunit